MNEYYCENCKIEFTVWEDNVKEQVFCPLCSFRVEKNGNLLQSIENIKPKEKLDLEHMTKEETENWVNGLPEGYPVILLLWE